MAALAHGKVQTNNVELTLAKHLRRLVFLADLESGVLERRLLHRTYLGQHQLSTDASAVILYTINYNCITVPYDATDLASCFARCMQRFGVASEELSDIAYAVAHVNGLTFTSVAYDRENSRASFWVSHTDVTTE